MLLLPLLLLLSAVVQGAEAGGWLKLQCRSSNISTM
jgi:hypothetical protein